jgi:nucleoside-diphosphate-sugar epimerase
MTISGKRLLVTGGSGFIGANFIDEIDRRGGYEQLNLDVNPPRFEAKSGGYEACDLLDLDRVVESVTRFAPEQIVHFASRTDMAGVTVDDYAANHIGTRNLITAIQQTPSVKRVVFTSSQYVLGPGRLPEHDLDYGPHTIYGQSKVETENEVRKAKLDCEWTMIRPTNIWGRWHPRYPTEFWKVLKQGRYVHPGGAPVRRCYGYVGNVVDQVMKILTREDSSLNRKTLYVGDPPDDIYEWTNAFSVALTGKKVRVVPRPVLRGIGLVGDVVIGVGGKFPLFSSRYRSMTEDYVTPMAPTYAELGPPKYTLKEGVAETVAWLKTQGSFWD